MKPNQKSSSGGYENFLCPFTDMYITQGAGEGTHKGTMAVDVRGANSGVRYAYYAPCTLRCIKTYKESGQVMWQSTSEVRCANGYTGFVTLMTAHDDSMDAKIGQICPQGARLGNMGVKGNATGVHCHLEISQGKDTKWFKNKYGIYMFNNEKDLDQVCFFDDTNIMNRTEYLKPKYTTSPSNPGKNYVNLPPTISSWAIYDLNSSPVKKNAKAYLNPNKFGGLTYYVYAYHDNNTTAEIETRDYGRVKIYIYNTCAEITIDKPIYQSGNY
jgi:endolysin